MFKHITALVLVFFVLTGCASPLASQPTPQPATSVQTTPDLPVLRIAYCPTMSEEIASLMAIDPALQPMPFPNAASAIQALHGGQVDLIVIGRNVHAHESPQELAIIQLRAGYTLITERQRVVSQADLAGITVHTALPANTASSLLPAGTRLITHPNLEDAINAGLASAVLLGWDQVEPWHQLLIPLDAQGNKVASFRIPFLVYQAARAAELVNLLDAIQP